jgi:hypothetical protein
LYLSVKYDCLIVLSNTHMPPPFKLHQQKKRVLLNCRQWTISHSFYYIMLIIEDTTFKYSTEIKALYFYFNLCLSVKLDSLSWSFTSISFHTNLSELNKSFLEITDKNLNTEYFFLFVFSHHNAHAVATVYCNNSNKYISQSY